MKKYKNVFCTIGIVTLVLGIWRGNAISHANDIKQNIANSDELFLSKIIDEEIIGENKLEDNIYVDINNKLVNGINDYTEGRITEDEYLAICDEIITKIDSEIEKKIN